MRPRIEGSIGDECMEDAGYLKFTDENLKASFLPALQTMRKSKLFCDVILNVGNTDIHAHRNVLACVSPHLMELFSVDQENTSQQSDGTIPSYRLNGYINKIALQILVDYAYTAQMEIPDGLVKDVYLAAFQLRMDTVVNECARHLINELCVESCIEIRSLPGIKRNKGFVHEVDAFIAKEFAEVTETPNFLQLPRIQIEVLYQTKQEMTLVTHASLCRLVLDWIKRQITDDGVDMNNLLERSHLLYLALDNSLQDCSDVPSGHEVDSDIVQDYKRIASKCPTNKSRNRKVLAAPVRPRVLIYSRDIGEREDEVNCEPDWNLIGSYKVGDHTFVALVTLNGALTRISIQIRLNSPPTPSPVHTPDATSSLSRSIDESQAELFCEVASMSGPKCGLGVAELDGKLLVCGGYDREECLKMVESYCPETNTWTKQSSMIEARGRVQVAVLDGTIYAVGGSNGTTELDTVECLTKSATKWKKCCKLPLARSNAGVCELNGKIYCVGGWNGQSGIRQCDVYNPETDSWSSISPLHTGRYQVGLSTYNNKLFAVGGSDGWNCLGTVEMYDPETDQWTFVAPLLTPRRGCGLAEFNGKLYAVGGSDGAHSLSSTEVYDDETKTWVLGPNLTTPRSNVSVIVVKDKLYAIGGFSVKNFLNTMEYLGSNLNEWTTFVPQHTPDLDKIVEVLTNSLNNGELFNGQHRNNEINDKSKQNGTNGVNKHNGDAEDDDINADGGGDGDHQDNMNNDNDVGDHVLKKINGAIKKQKQINNNIKSSKKSQRNGDKNGHENKENGHNNGHHHPDFYNHTVSYNSKNNEQQDLKNDLNGEVIIAPDCS